MQLSENKIMKKLKVNIFSIFRVLAPLLIMYTFYSTSQEVYYILCYTLLYVSAGDCVCCSNPTSKDSIFRRWVVRIALLGNVGCSFTYFSTYTVFPALLNTTITFPLLYSNLHCFTFTLTYFLAQMFSL